MMSLEVSVIAVAILLLAPIACMTGDGAQPRYVIYLHGRIVQEQQSARPKHPRFGYYELEKILAAFRDRGLIVSGEIRPKLEPVNDTVDRVVDQVRQLLDSGVPADHITVVGASIGGSIALLASARLQNPNLRFCVLGACLSQGDRPGIGDGGKYPVGRVLAIREASDDLTDTCRPWKADDESKTRIVARELVLNTGLAHGFLYQPLPEWLDPVLEWVEAR